MKNKQQEANLKKALNKATEKEPVLQKLTEQELDLVSGGRRSGRGRGRP